MSIPSPAGESHSHSKLDSYYNSSKSLFDRLRQCLLICDENTRVRHANKAAVALLQRDEDALRGLALSDLCGAAGARFAGARPPAKATLNLPFQCRNGGTVECETVVARIFDEDRTAIGFVVSFADPSVQLKDIIQKFRQHNVVLIAFDRLSSNICYVTDIQTNDHIFMSDGITGLLGWPAEDFVKGGIGFSLSIVHPDDHRIIGEEVAPFIERFREDPDPTLEPFVYRLRMRHRDGQYVKCRITCMTIQHDGSGAPQYSLCFINPEGDKHLNGTAAIVKLTDREREIAALLVQGMSSKMIADCLHISVHTVNDLRKQLLRKFNVSNTAALVSTLTDNGLL